MPGNSRRSSSRAITPRRLPPLDLATPGTVDALTAITVQQIQHQVLSILLQAAAPESSGETRTATDTIGAGPADSEESGNEPGKMSPSISADGEVKTLELGDLMRLTRITSDLSRIMTAQRKRAEQLGERARQARASQPASQPQGQDLSREVSQSMLNALLAIHSIAPPTTIPPPPPENAAEPIKSVSDIAVRAKPQQNAPQSRRPQLTAPGRIYPHRKRSADSCHIRSSTRSGPQCAQSFRLSADIGPLVNLRRVCR